MLTLLVIKGGQKGQAYHVNGDQPATVGRRTAEVQLQDTRVSRRHARIYLEQGQWWIEDLGSSNGTWVNKHSISEPTQLNEGDQLHIGRLELVVDRAAVDAGYDDGADEGSEALAGGAGASAGAESVAMEEGGMESADLDVLRDHAEADESSAGVTSAGGEEASVEPTEQVEEASENGAGAPLAPADDADVDVDSSADAEGDVGSDVAPDEAVALDAAAESDAGGSGAGSGEDDAVEVGASKDNAGEDDLGEAGADEVGAGEDDDDALDRELEEELASILAGDDLDAGPEMDPEAGAGAEGDAGSGAGPPERERPEEQADDPDAPNEPEDRRGDQRGSAPG